MRVQFLQEQLDAYLALRESLGHINKSHRRQLQAFIAYADRNSESDTIRASIAIDWACGTTGTRSASTKFALLSVARNFLIYVKASRPETEIPDRNLIGSLRRPTPYIFSDSDICSLLQAASDVSRRAAQPKHAAWYRTCEYLIGLLACTGIRTKEAINLTISDVHLDEMPPCLLIRQSKFKKSRWVPLHPTAAKRLSAYAKTRSAVGSGASDPFFVSIEGKKISYKGIYKTFRRLVRRAGIKDVGKGRGPTLHGLRHTFAVNRLREWYESGADPRILAPTLSVYMGHVNVAATYWYISATPELLTSAAELFQRYSEGDNVK